MRPPIDPDPVSSRRQWLLQTSAALGSLALLSEAKGGQRGPGSDAYHPGRIARFQPPQVPEGQAIPFDWPVAELRPGQDVVLQWPRVPRGEAVWFRLTSLTDVREEFLIDLQLADSGRTIGTLDCRFSHYMQPFETTLVPADLAALQQEGLRLRVAKGSKPFWFYYTDDPAAITPFMPHLLPQGTGPAGPGWARRLNSLASVQTFGWMEGCVLDGLYDQAATKARGAKQALSQHLGLYFRGKELVYEGLVHQRLVNRINGVETVLPFAVLAKVQPDHPAIAPAIQFCRDHADARGVIADGTIGSSRPLKTEECYTVAYPLAVLGRQLKRPDLTELALSTIQARTEGLAAGESVYQRMLEGEKPVFENWSRGVAWYLLGLARTLDHLPNDNRSETVRADFRRVAGLVSRYQRPDGLWNCFMHQPETGPETSGTAGITAALALGYSRGWLPPSYGQVVRTAWQGLQAYLSPDGYLRGTAQVNKGGESLQRNGFRVISPYTLGFLGQIQAAQSRR